MFIYKRVINNQLLDLAKKYPIVTVLGPRQSGKTTLVKNCYENKPYVNLEARDVQEIAINDPRQFLSQYPNGAIFDEIQNAPDLLSYIQIIVYSNHR